MGTINSLPVISQFKSLVQFLAKDYKGAYQTQKDFTQEFLLIAPLRLLFEKIFVSNEAARETGLKLTKALSNVLDAIPLVGHVKGGIHYAYHDHEGGDRALKSASRTVGVLAGGIAGSFGSPVVAIAGGLAGGQAMDSITTFVDSLVHKKEYRPNGSWAGIHKLVVGESSVGEGFDTIAGLALDGFAGYCCQGLGDTIANTYKSIGIVDSGVLAKTALDVTVYGVSVSARSLSQRSSYEDLYPEPEITDMTKLRKKRQQNMENNNDLEGNYFKVKPGKLTYSLHEKKAILEASTYSIKFENRNHEDRIEENPATQSPNHLAIVFENDFAISWGEDTYKKKLLVLHAYPMLGKTPPKVRILVEFFDTFEEIKKELYGRRSNNYSYHFSKAGMSYVGLQDFSQLFANVLDKDFIWNAPLLMHVEEAKKNNSFANCKRFTTMLCDICNLKLEDETKKAFLDMNILTTEERELMTANGWTNPQLFWKYA